MITPKEKANELYNRFDMIIYTSHDYKSQIFYCMSYYIESMINESCFIENEERIDFWEKVKVCKEEMKLI